MRKELFDQLVASVKEMKAVERGELKPARVTRSEDLLATDVRALRAHFGLSPARRVVRHVVIRRHRTPLLLIPRPRSGRGIYSLSGTGHWLPTPPARSQGTASPRDEGWGTEPADHPS